jgi:hypothetical protein
LADVLALVAILLLALATVAGAVLLALLLTTLLWCDGSLSALPLLLLFTLPARLRRRRCGSRAFLFWLWGRRAAWLAALTSFSLLVLLSLRRRCGQPPLLAISVLLLRGGHGPFWRRRAVRSGRARVSALNLEAQALGIASGSHQRLLRALCRFERSTQGRLGALGRRAACLS